MQPTVEFTDDTVLGIVRYIDEYTRAHQRCPRAADIVIDVADASPALLVAMAQVGFVILFGAPRWEDRVCGLLRNGARLLPDADDRLALVVRVLDHLKHRYRERRRAYVIKPAELAADLGVSDDEATAALTLLLTWPHAISHMWNDPATGLVPVAEIDIGILGLHVEPANIERLCPWETDLPAAPDSIPASPPRLDELIEEYAPEIARRWNAGEFQKRARKQAAAALAQLLSQRRGLHYAERTLYSKFSSYITRHPQLFVPLEAQPDA